MVCFSPEQCQGVGMNSDGHNQNEHQHQCGYIPYGHTKYVHGYINSMPASIFL
jgi:hypothetical protein